MRSSLLSFIRFASLDVRFEELNTINKALFLSGMAAFLSPFLLILAGVTYRVGIFIPLSCFLAMMVGYIIPIWGRDFLSESTYEIFHGGVSLAAIFAAMLYISPMFLSPVYVLSSELLL